MKNTENRKLADKPVFDDHFGYIPKVGLDEALNRTVKWYQQYKR